MESIENNGERFVVVVNRDPFHKQRIKLLLLPDKHVIDISSSKNKEYSLTKTINLTLEKGGYVIFKEL